ncbi:MAG: hypothetical protein M1813_007971 [Trichoglossum hirsutum]|nr:MAG: hypothetical protein M1813_007971 [Trichoglossum hirsutum]
MDHSLRLTHGDYTVACVCPMGVELAPVEAMLDEVHQSLPASRDQDNYTLGRMGSHNIVIAVMPEIGNNNAATVATQLLNDFGSIRFSLLVGIGGGIPGGEDDIRLGDVVVSKPTDTFGGVVQFDRGKIHPDGRFELTGTLGKPPAMLMATVQKLQAQQKREGNKISRYLSDMLRRFPNMEEEYVYPGMEHDQAFEAGYHHEGRETCKQCDRSKIIERAPRKDTIPRIHYGTIGSSNEVVKDSVTRDKLRTDLGILCVEMEAAGLMDELPCLVIRGICDYADSHKSKRWQPYAAATAATAAAYAKELLSLVPAMEAVVTTKAADAFKKIPLPYAAQAPFYSSDNSDKQHDRICLPNTRVGVLNEISEWANRANGGCIYWLNGMAGTGKSTIARTVARRFHKQKSLGASFFFSRGTDDRSHAGKFFTTIALQLANISPTLNEHIRKAVAEHNDIADRSQRDQWRHLILQPLSMLKANPCQSSLVLVIDALDECDSDKDVRGILQLLTEAKSLRPTELRIFVTSRPEVPIRLGFRNMPDILHQDLALHQISRTVVNKDIFGFFKFKLEEIRKASDYLPVSWPGKETIDLLVLKADGLFIYAATVCRFVEESGEQWAPDDLLHLFLPNERADSLVWDAIILKYSLKGIHNLKDKQYLASILRQVVGTVAILFNPLSAIAIARLLDVDDGKVQMRLRHLHSVLEIPDSQGQPLQLLHPSFRDFLLDKGRCSDQLFWVDGRKTHSSLAENCLRLMSTTLKRDACNIHGLGARANNIRVEQRLPPELQYACRYWVQHLRKGEVQLDDNGKVHDFLRDHLLHWIETLSLIRKTSEGILAISSLESMVMAERSPHLGAFIHDAKRFVLYNRLIIEKAPLQIYHSALVFAPETSIIRRQFKDQIPHWIRRLPKVQRVWGSLLQTLEGCGSVIAMVFSPNGKLIASASYDCSVRLWDAATGSPQTFEGHSGWVTDVAFSPDSKLVASASCDCTVRLWNIATGSSQTLEGHSGRVEAIAFSPDGKLVASASDDKTVRLWSATTCSSLQTFKGHSYWIDVAFSPDGKLVASASYDCTVWLWDAATGSSRTLKGHSDKVNAVTFSPNGRSVASASSDHTVRLWDAATGSSLQTLTGHSGFVSTVAFSSDGKLVASASGDYTVGLWNTATATGSSLQMLKGHSRQVNAIAFSLDGKLVASASDDSTVRLWDAATGSLLGTLEGHSGQVRAIAFSPDGKLVVSASADWTIRLWDAATSSSLPTHEGHSNCVFAIAFSPDSKLVASGSYDRTVTLWDAATGSSLRTLKGHSHHVDAVTFSPDGKLVASGSKDYTVRLWNAATGSPLQTLKGHLGGVNGIAFSLDNEFVASVSSDCTVRLWNAATGSSLQTLKGHSARVNTVAFSPDGKLVVSTSDDRTARLWNATTGSLLQMFDNDGRFTYSSGGSYRLGQRLLNTGYFSPSDIPLRSDSSKLGVRGHWITVGDEDVIWLPPGYRVVSAAVRDNIIFLGSGSGRVTSLEFDLSQIPLSRGS